MRTLDLLLLRSLSGSAAGSSATGSSSTATTTAAGDGSKLLRALGNELHHA
jgi:hypothetical protein